MPRLCCFLIFRIGTRIYINIYIFQKEKDRSFLDAVPNVTWVLVEKSRCFPYFIVTRYPARENMWVENSIINDGMEIKRLLVLM